MAADNAAHVHEWEAAGMVEMPHTYHSPVSRNDNVTVNRIYVIQSCKCGSTRHKQVAEGSGARIKR